jgi:hypothetical protein
VHDAGSGRMARRKVASETEEPALVDYADKEPSAFASMLGGLIEANVKASPDKRRDFGVLVARVGIFVNDIDEGVTLDFKGGRLTMHNGLKPRRTITIRTDAETVMSLSSLKIGLLGLPVYYDEVGRGVAVKLLRGKLKIDGLLPNIMTLNAVTRIFSVQYCWLERIPSLALPLVPFRPRPRRGRGRPPHRWGGQWEGINDGTSGHRRRVDGGADSSASGPQRGRRHAAGHERRVAAEGGAVQPHARYAPRGEGPAFPG